MSRKKKEPLPETQLPKNIKCEEWVPAELRSRFEADYHSGFLMLRECKLNPQGYFEQNRTLTVPRAIKNYEQDMQAVRRLVTSMKFQSFWKKQTKESAEEIYNKFNKMLVARFRSPSITLQRKIKQVEKIRKHLYSALSLIKLDPSIEAEVDEGFTYSLWDCLPLSRTIESDRQAVSRIKSEQFFSKLLLTLQEQNVDTHGSYPVRPTSERRFFVIRCAEIFGNKSLSNPSEIADKTHHLFPHLRINKANVEVTIREIKAAKTKPKKQSNKSTRRKKT